jgi:putative membrane protein
LDNKEIEVAMNEGATPPQPRPTSSKLAESTTSLAIERTRLAIERTLMAWVRTSLSMISFGFTIYKFLQDMRKLETSRLSDHGPRNFGLALVGLGTAALIVASIQYWRRMRELRQSAGKKKFPLAMFVAIAISLLGLLVFFSMVTSMGPF